MEKSPLMQYWASTSLMTSQEEMREGHRRAIKKNIDQSHPQNIEKKKQVS